MDSIVITTGLRQIQQVKSFHGRSSSGCVQERFLEQHLCFPAFHNYRREEHAVNEDVIRVFENLCEASERHLKAFVGVLLLLIYLIHLLLFKHIVVFLDSAGNFSAPVITKK